MGERRKRIGVFIGNADAYHTRTELRGMYDAAAKSGVDIIVFSGNQIEYCFFDVDEIESDFNHYIEAMHDYVRVLNIDALIICFESHTIFMDADFKKKFIDCYSDIPCVFLQARSDKDNAAAILSDNYGGMRSVVEHLVKFHGYTKLVYLGGSENDYEAIERLRAFKDVLRENDIPINDTMIAYGNFADFSKEQVKYLLDNNKEIEAFVCANDIMACGVYTVFKERGIKIGNPRINEGAIAVTGYDDSDYSSRIDPALTTVRQGFFSSGYFAVEKVLKLLAKESLASELVHTQLIARSSCGCSYGYRQWFVPPNDTEKVKPEFYAVKVAEKMKEEILLDGVEDAIGDKVYGILFEAISKDVLMWQGITHDTLTPLTVTNQLRELIHGEYVGYISVNALLTVFAEFVSCMIHYSKRLSETVLLSDILLEGTRYIQTFMNGMYANKKDESSMQAWQMSLMQRKMFLNLQDKGKLLEAALDTIASIDKKEVYLFLFDEPRTYVEGEKWKTIGSVYLAAYLDKEGKTIVTDDRNREYISDDFFWKLISSKETSGVKYVVSAIHFSKKEYGLIVGLLSQDDIVFQYMCGIQIGMALHESDK